MRACCSSQRFLLATIILLLCGVPSWATPTYHIVEKDGKVGLADSTGNLIIPTEYEELGWSSSGNIVPQQNCIGYKHNGFWGLLSLKNNRLTAPEYYSIQPFGTTHFLASTRKVHLRGPVFGILNSKGEETLPFRYFQLRKVDNLVIANRWKDGILAYGLLDLQNKIQLSFVNRNIEFLGSNLFAVTNQKGKTALYHQRGDWLTSFDYDRVFPFQGEYAEVNTQGMKGLLDQNGALVIPPIYKSIEFLAKDSVVAQEYPSWLLISANRDTLATLRTDTVWPIANNTYQLARGTDDMLWNDSIGIFLVPGYRTQLSPFDQGIAIHNTDNRVGAINLFGQTIVPAKYDTLYRAGDYFFAGTILNDSLAWDIWNTVGHQINTTAFDNLRPLREGYFPAKQYGRWGFLNTQGEIALGCIYDTIPQPFLFGHAVVKFHGLQGIIDTAGKWTQIPEEGELRILSPKLYERKKGRLTEIKYLADNELFLRNTGRLISRSDGFLAEEDGKVGLKNWAGDWTILPDYDSISLPIAGKFYAYVQGEESGILTLSGDQALLGSEGFQSIYAVDDEFFPVKISGRFGFVDDQARLRVANRYDSVAAFSEDRASIMLRGRWGAIDRHERLRIQPLYDQPFFIKDGQAIVLQEGRYGIINADGKTLLPLEYDEIQALSSGRFLIRKGELYGLLAHDATSLIQTRYQSLEETQNQELIIQRRRKYGLIATNGRDLLPTLFSALTFDKIHRNYLAKVPGAKKHIILP